MDRSALAEGGRESVKLPPPGATRRDRTGDLLITKFRVAVYAIDSVFGGCRCTLADSAWSARIEPCFEPNFAGQLERGQRSERAASHAIPSSETAAAVTAMSATIPLQTSSPGFQTHCLTNPPSR